MLSSSTSQKSSSSMRPLLLLLFLLMLIMLLMVGTWGFSDPVFHLYPAQVAHLQRHSFEQWSQIIIISVRYLISCKALLDERRTAPSWRFSPPAPAQAAHTPLALPPIELRRRKNPQKSRWPIITNIQNCTKSIMKSSIAHLCGFWGLKFQMPSRQIAKSQLLKFPSLGSTHYLSINVGRLTADAISLWEVPSRIALVLLLLVVVL